MHRRNAAKGARDADEAVRSFRPSATWLTAFVLCGLAATTSFGLDQRQGEAGERPSVLPSDRPARTRPVDAGMGFPLAERKITLVPPRLHPRTNELPGRLQGKLERSFSVAVGKVTQVAECRNLFEPLLRDGVEALASSLYSGATEKQTARWCRRGATALTAVGSPLIRLCPSFAALTPNEGAITLIHEALHFSGLDEERSGGTTGALTSHEINRVVRVACRL